MVGALAGGMLDHLLILGRMDGELPMLALGLVSNCAFGQTTTTAMTWFMPLVGDLFSTGQLQAA
jgi:hypothetical protein